MIVSMKHDKLSLSKNKYLGKKIMRLEKGK